MYEITYLPISKQDISDIIQYISGQLKAPQAAINLLDALEHSIALLAEFPYAHKLFRPIRPLEEEYRMITVKNYAIFYVIREEQRLVEIHRIIYARMDLSRLIK